MVHKIRPQKSMRFSIKKIRSVKNAHCMWYAIIGTKKNENLAARNLWYNTYSLVVFCGQSITQGILPRNVSKHCEHRNLTNFPILVRFTVHSFYFTRNLVIFKKKFKYWKSQNLSPVVHKQNFFIKRKECNTQ